MNIPRRIYSLMVLTLIIGVPQVRADSFGKLFTTPEQRARIDAARNGAVPALVKPGEGGDVAASSDRVKLNGTLLSSTGKKEVWLNGKTRLGDGGVEGTVVQLVTTDKVRVITGSGATPHFMKPGQVLDTGTGQVSESYQRSKAQPVEKGRQDDSP